MKKLIKLFFVFLLAVSMIANQTKKVDAWDSTIPHEFTRVKSISYPSWWSSKISSARAWSTTMCTYNGSIAYCLESSKNTPVTGSYVASVIDNNSNVRKLLYYGYGGPGYDGEMEKLFERYLSACVPDDFSKSRGNFDDGAYLFTHIWLSYAYSGDLMGLSLEDFNRKWSLSDGTGGYGDTILAGYYEIIALPEPQRASFSVNGTNDSVASLSAAFDQENKVQKTETVTFNGSANATTNVTLQENVTLHNVTTGQSQTGGSAVVYGGQSFYLTAPLKNSPEDYTSGNIAGEKCERFEALAIVPGGGYQTEGSYAIEPSFLQYKVNWMELGALRLSKVNNSSNFQKGAKFRLVSTSFEGFDETFEVAKDENGDYELLIDYLPVGTYSLTEVDCEDYFAPVVAQWSVEIEKDKTTKKVVVNTLRPTGTLNVQKTLESALEGIKDVSDDDITKTSFKIVAADDIKDTVSLKDLYAKGDLISLGSGKCIIDASQGNLVFSDGVKLEKGTANDDGTFSVDKDGKLVLSGIPLGKYEVIETSCPDGYVLDQNAHEVIFVQEDYTTTIYTQDVNQTNTLTKTVFSKKTVTGEDELPGASLKVTDKEGKVIDQWTSTDKPHEIDGLKTGETYTLHEDLAPLGYVLSSSIDFKVNDDGKIQSVEMKDKVITVSKEDLGGRAVEGAHLQVIDEDGKVVDEWISTNQVHQISNLEEGKTYILHEDLAPAGYNLVNDFEFTVTETKENQEIKLIDTMTTVKKVDEDNKAIKGAALEVVSTKTNEVADRWVSGQHMIDIDESMKQKLLNKETVSGSNENGEYTIVDNNGDYLVMMKQKDDVSYYRVDIEGNETVHMVQNLIAGEEYILKETSTPKGYATAAQQTFTVSDEKETTLTMIDEITKIVFHKQDITTKKELPGASLVVKDEDGNIIDEWTSTDKPHQITGLEVGKTYTMEETIAPDGYKLSEKVTFTVHDTGVEQHIYMYDEKNITVKTGDNSDAWIYLFSGSGSLSLLYFVLRKMKKA